jgi:hypothetical protein
VFGGAGAEVVETDAEAVEAEVETVETVEMVETETEVVDVDPAKVEAVEDQQFGWLKICTRKSDDTEPSEIELSEMESLFP